MTATKPTAIPMFDYRIQYAEMKTEILAAVERVFDSGWLLFGDELRSFEAEFAAYLGDHDAEHAVGVANGTDALAIALRALDVGTGHEVITVSNTAIPTVSAIRMVGAQPVFCDVDPATSLIDLAQVRERLTSRTKAIIPVHLFGNVVDMGKLGEIAHAHDVTVVEDCAQSAGAALRGRPSGTMGDIGCFSFYPTKNLGAYGDGGLCFARDPEIAARMRRIRFYGCDKAYYAEEEGVNSRLDEVQAAILRVKLAHLDEHVAKRRAIAARYDALLSPEIERTPATGDATHAYHLYVVKHDRRDEIMAHLKREGIGCGIHYPVPVHLMRAYNFLGWGEDSLPATERLASRLLSLPIFPELGDDAVERVARAVNDAVG